MSKTELSIDLESLGKAIKAARERLDWTTQKLSEKSGVSTTRINQIENCVPSETTGKVRRPKASTISQLATALSLDDGDLLRLAGYLAQSSTSSRFQAIEQQLPQLAPQDRQEIEILIRMIEREVAQRRRQSSITPEPLTEAVIEQVLPFYQKR